MKQIEQEIKTLVEQGFSVQKIATKLNLSRELVNSIILKNNFKLKNEIFSEDKIDYIVQLYKEGVSAKKLGFKFKIDKRRVQKWAKEKGCLRNSNDSRRITFFNQEYFDDIDTKEKAYWLGFLYADGYNSKKTNTITLTLKGEDITHLKKLAIELKLPMDKIKKRTSSIVTNGIKKKYSVCSLRLYSKYLCNILTNKGCPQAKSFIIKYPDWLDEKLNKHFIRGIFDGDGCLTFRKKQKEWKWSITGTKECCDKINEILNKTLGINCGIYYISQTNNNTYDLMTSGNEKIKKILDWLYEDSDKHCRLDRKHDKYLQLCVQQDNRQIGREKYFLNPTLKNNILKDLENGMPVVDVAEKYDKTVSSIFRLQGKYLKNGNS